MSTITGHPLNVIHIGGQLNFKSKCVINAMDPNYNMVQTVYALKLGGNWSLIVLWIPVNVQHFSEGIF